MKDWKILGISYDGIDYYVYCRSCYIGKYSSMEQLWKDLLKSKE